MVRCRHGQARGITELLVVLDSLEVILPDAGFNRRVKPFGPGSSPRIAPVDQPQIMHDIATAQDQHPLLAQRSDLLPDREMDVCRSLTVDTELGNRDIGLRIHPGEDRPGAMIDAPVVVDDHWVRLDQSPGYPTQVWGTGGRIFQVIQSRWKSVQVIDLTGQRLVHDPRPLRIPVGGYRQDGRRARQLASQGLPLASPVIVFNSVHRRTMADKKDGHANHRLIPPAGLRVR